ncbi:expressed protein isoform B [Micractinium conductrix]|uniref:Expressed protein isoform A n=1 Tax=Micractinium conductrix TaxID=554055 RepID=A0A2P6VEX8_9CHLO|nr:expressed protein isoform A [Micractinium conductrix]PSC72646.1 expressed protein isoform B [Micractinium conductrix]|eukprot:PSC72645.1 expressed protein isoform A [Micractinium conductrix]
MATLWSIVANWLIPVPLGLFLLTSLPLPRNFRRGTLLFTQRVFDLPIVGAFKLLHIMLWITALAFLSSARQVQVMRQTQADQVFTTPNQEIAVLSKRWRAERNLWLSAFAFSSWVFLAAFYREAVRRLELEARLSDLERSEFTATEPLRGGDREASVSREVTSKAAAAASRDRTPLAGNSPNKTGSVRAAAHPAAAELVGAVPGGRAAAGVEMQGLKKDM